MSLILPVIAGLGLFLVVLGLSEYGNQILSKPKSALLGLGADENAGKPPRTRTSLRDWMQGLLYQAHAPLTLFEFGLVSAGIGLLVGMGTFLATGALLVSLVGLALGAFLYYLYLLARRDRLAREYEDVQPQVVYGLYFSLKSGGLNFQGMLKKMAEEGPEIVREDWRRVAAALHTSRIDVEALNKLLTDRNSPGLTRIVEALVLFREENIAQLPRILEDLRRDISLEVEIAREGATHVYGARRQLLLVALMPALLAIVFILVLPSFKAFYQGFFGQILLLGVLAFSAVLYWFGARAAARASLVRPYQITFPEARSAAVYLPFKGEPAASKDPNGFQPVSFAGLDGGENP